MARCEAAAVKKLAGQTLPGAESATSPSTSEPEPLLDTSLDGLSQAEAERRLREIGPNGPNELNGELHEHHRDIQG
jgi:hypothetical protein